MKYKEIEVFENHIYTDEEIEKIKEPIDKYDGKKEDYEAFVADIESELSKQINIKSLTSANKRAYISMYFYIKNGCKNLSASPTSNSNLVKPVKIFDGLITAFNIRYSGEESDSATIKDNYTDEKIALLLKKKTKGAYVISATSVERYYEAYVAHVKNNIIIPDLVRDDDGIVYDTPTLPEVIKPERKPLIDELNNLSDDNYNLMQLLLGRILSQLDSVEQAKQFDIPQVPKLIGNPNKPQINYGRFIDRVKLLGGQIVRVIFEAEDRQLIRAHNIPYYEELPLSVNRNLNMLNLTDAQLDYFAYNVQKNVKEIGEIEAKESFGEEKAKTNKYYKAYKKLQKLKAEYPEEYSDYQAYRLHTCNNFLNSTPKNIVAYADYQVK